MDSQRLVAVYPSLRLSLFDVRRIREVSGSVPSPVPIVVRFELTLSRTSFTDPISFVTRLLPPGVKDFATALVGAVVSAVWVFEPVEQPPTPQCLWRKTRLRAEGHLRTWEHLWRGSWPL